MTTTTTDVPAVTRALQLLEALAATPDGLSAGELLRQLALSRSTLYALLGTLKAHGYVRQNGQRGRYRLGPALFGLIPAHSRDLDTLAAAFHSDSEAQLLSETLALAHLDGQQRVIFAQQESRETVRAVFPPGERRPAAESAAGLVLMAALPPDTLSHHWPAADANLPNVLLQIRQQGLATTSGAEAIELAAPVCADGVHPLAALVMLLPTFRYQQAEATELAGQLRQTAARLSYRLGAPVYQPYGWATGEALEPSTPLAGDELARFLQGPWGARLACLRDDGTPHVVPLWYEWDGEHIWVAASPGAYWKTYVTGSGQVSLTIDEPWPPLRRALVAGRAFPASDGEINGGLAGLRRRLASRYLGRGAEMQGDLAQTEDWQAFRIVPDKIVGHRGLGR